MLFLETNPRKPHSFPTFRLDCFSKEEQEPVWADDPCNQAVEVSFWRCLSALRLLLLHRVSEGYSMQWFWGPQFSVRVGTKPKAWRDYWASEWMQSPARPWNQPASAMLLVLVSRSLFCCSKNWFCLVADDDVLCPILYFLQSPILTVAFWILDAMEIVGMLKIVAAPLVAVFMEPAWVAQ